MSLSHDVRKKMFAGWTDGQVSRQLHNTIQLYSQNSQFQTRVIAQSNVSHTIITFLLINSYTGMMNDISTH